MNGLFFPLGAFYFRFISNDWLYLFIAFLVVTGVIAVLSMILPESPKFLFEKGKYEEAREVVIRMARMNGVEEMAKGCWVFEGEEKEVAIINDINDSITDSILSLD
mmetsp:Transcript_201/g.195  ORF Transcript_201/g.195 Transcript_201/m.195 type:complete len:106 (+) Transcript_201:575-892(+)